MALKLARFAHSKLHEKACLCRLAVLSDCFLGLSVTGVGRYVKLYIATPMHSSQLCVAAPPSMAVRSVDGRTGAWCALHSYRVCRNLISSSPARKRLSLMSRASSRASAFSFISRLAST